MMLFLERKSIKKSFQFETGMHGIPKFLPGNGSMLLIEQ